MQVGSDDDGYAVRMRFEHFLRYCAYQHHAGSDDSPLYIFDGTFADRSGSAAMAKQYSVPGLFKEDLFQLAGERRRPPYRCVVVTIMSLMMSMVAVVVSAAAWRPVAL
jgi:histone arginine demethylase JMJD6